MLLEHNTGAPAETFEMQNFKETVCGRYLGPPPGEAKAADAEVTKEEKADEADDAEPVEEEAVLADEKSDDKTDETKEDEKEVKEDDKEAKDEEE